MRRPCSFKLKFFHNNNGLDSPEVGGEVGAGEVVVRGPTVVLYAPLCLPGVPDEEHATLVIIPDGHHGVSAEISLPFHLQEHEARVHKDRPLERLIEADIELEPCRARALENFA